MVTRTELKRISLKNIVQNSTIPEAWTYEPDKMEWLKRSHEESGQITYPEARKTGSVYSLRHGHHRIETARRLGWTHYELMVGDFSDDEMREGHRNENDEAGGANEAHYVRVWKSYEKDMEDKGELDGLGERDRKSAIAKLAGMYRDDATGLTSHGQAAVRLIERALPTAAVTGLDAETAETLTLAANSAFAIVDRAVGLTPKEAKTAGAQVRRETQKQMKLVGAGNATVSEATKAIREAGAVYKPKNKKRGRPIDYGKMIDTLVKLFDKSRKREAEDVRSLIAKSRFASHSSIAKSYERGAKAIRQRAKRDEELAQQLDSAADEIRSRAKTDKETGNANVYALRARKGN